MKLTLVTEHYPPDFGGVATSARRIARELAMAGHGVQVVTFDRALPFDDADRISTESDGAVHVHRVGPFHVSAPVPHKECAVFRRRACDQMVRLATTFMPDAFLALYVLNAGFLTRFAAMELDRPYVVSVRGNDIGRDVFDTERFAAVRWTLEGAAGIACVNERLRRRVMTVVPSLSLPIVIPNGVASSARPVSARVDGDLVVVFIGMLREKKGVRTLLTALRAVADSLPIRLLVIGPAIADAERQTVGTVWDQLCKKGVVSCTGELPHEEVAARAATGDVVVMASVDDGVANGLLEGMALGLCPVVSMLFRDVVQDGETGLLFDPSDVDDLVGVLRRLVGDRRLVRRLGDAARDYAREYHRPECEAAAYERLITSTTRSAAAAAPPMEIVD